MALAAAMGASACTSTPQDLRAGEEPAKDSIEAGYWMAAGKAERRIKTSGKLIDDPALQDYANRIACEVASDYCGDIRVYVVRQPDFNASMMPNGAMTIWSGLLLRTRNEAQLAAVIGHEIAHFQRRHTWARAQETRATANVAMLFNVAVAMAGVAPAQTLVNLIALGHVSAFSREHEREADEVGFHMMAEAGYRPEAAARVWQGMTAERDAGDLEQPLPFLATHPPGEERLETLRSLAAERDGGNAGRTEEQRYLAHIAPHRGGWLEDELDLRRWQRMQLLLDRLLEQGARPGELLYYQGELHRRRGAAGDIAAAISAYREALTYADAPAETHRALGFVLWDQARPTAARNAFQTYLDAAPAAHDRAMIRAYIDQLSGGTS